MVLKLIFSQFFCDTDYVKVPDTSKAICQVFTLNIILIIIFIIVIVIITILIVIIMILFIL